MPVASPAAPSRRRTPAASPTVQGAGRGIVRKLRQQGGTIIVPIPPHLLAELGLTAGSEVEMSVLDGKLVAEPKASPVPARRRYTLAELLEGAEQLPALYAGTEGALDGPPVGREKG